MSKDNSSQEDVMVYALSARATENIVITPVGKMMEGQIT